MWEGDSLRRGLENEPVVRQRVNANRSIVAGMPLKNGTSCYCASE